MKWLILMLMFLTLLVTSLIVGCATVDIVQTAEVDELKLPEEIFTEPQLGFDLYYGDFEVSNIQEISALILTHMTIIPGTDFNDPETIYKNKSGTRNDFPIMFMNIAKVVFDVELDLAIIDTSVYLGANGYKYHAMVSYNEVVYNVYDTRYYFPLQPLYLYRFKAVFKDKVFNIEKIPMLNSVYRGIKNIRIINQIKLSLKLQLGTGA